jgi:hypothetical protein
MQGKNKISGAQAAVNGKLLRKAIRVISRDGCMAPIHEAGHMVVASSFGAEACRQDRAIWSVSDELDWCDPTVMSESVWCFADCHVGEPNQALFTAIDKVGALLRPDVGPLWLELIQIERDLIVQSRALEPLADGEISAEAAA